jgi:signal transduction histidine kinase
VWSSGSVLRLERAELAARERAALEENTRLALWRLDSTLMPLLAREQGPASTECRGGGVRTIPAALAGDLIARLPPEPPPVVAKAVPKDAQAALQSMKNVQEFKARQQALEQANSLALPRAVPSPPPASAREGALTALWIGDALVLARRVGVGGAVHVQGCWLDWPRLRGELLASVEDLLPGARLEPATSAQPDEERRLATLPVRLLPGRAAPPPPAGLSPTRLSLAGLWACALLAAVAVAVLLRGVMELSERRRVFVSAVTHELRTPLTTFRLYTDMLAEGMVAPEEKRRDYVGRLRIEAERLGHLVENVLFYARVESGRGAAAQEVFELGPALEEMRPRLAERAARSGLELACVQDGGAAGAKVQADRSALEQVLLNLVDNACKYAAASTPARVEVELRAADGRAAIRVRDHGPGLSAAGRRKLFQPFSKSDREAANSAPGIGLGLALSRRLARAQGGELSLEASGPDGAVFVLSLPLARSR